LYTKKQMKRNFCIYKRSKKGGEEENNPFEQHYWTIVDTPQQLVRSRCTTPNAIIEGGV